LLLLLLLLPPARLAGPRVAELAEPAERWSRRPLPAPPTRQPVAGSKGYFVSLWLLSALSCPLCAGSQRAPPGWL